jgi:hypothetical protein
MKFKFKFSKECLYPIDPKNENDYDINKLCGFGHGYHRWNSIRLGWLPTEDGSKIGLYRYCYNEGSRIPDYIPILLVDVEKWYEATPEINELFKTATFAIRDAETGFSLCTASIAYKCPRFKWGYKLKPYFGGDNPAKQDMAISIEELAY